MILVCVCAVWKRSNTYAYACQLLERETNTATSLEPSGATLGLSVSKPNSVGINQYNRQLTGGYTSMTPSLADAVTLAVVFF